MECLNFIMVFVEFPLGNIAVIDFVGSWTQVFLLPMLVA